MTQSQTCRDHLGMEYPSQEAMLKHYGVDGSEVSTGHKKNTADAWGINLEAFHTRLRKAAADAWKTDFAEAFGRKLRASLRQAGRLAQPETCVDPCGRKYPNQEAMLRTWGVDKSAISG